MPHLVEFSRCGSPLGKLTEQIPAIRIDGDTKEMLDRAAHQAGLSLVEFIRELLMIRAHGLKEVQRIYADRLQRVSESAKES